jgi:membrane protease subunit HflK
MEDLREGSWKDILLSGLRSVPYRNRRFLAMALVAVVGIYFLSGIYAIQPEELGVVVRFGKVVAEGVPPGIHYHLPRPVERVFKPKVAEIKQVFVGAKSEERSQMQPGGGLEMLTGDTNVIMAQVIIQYAVSDPVKYLFSTENATWMVENAAEEALTRIVGSMGVDALLTTEKLKAQNLIRDRIQQVLDSYDVGVQTIGAYFQDISPPVEVAYAFRDVASAREDKNRLVNEAEGYRNAILPTTRGQAEGMISDAQGYSKERVERASGEADRFSSLYDEYRKSKDITASRIYVEKMEKVLPNLRIYVVDKEGGKAVTTLRLMKGSQAQTGSSGGPAE